jgi:hypothetical protein
MASCAFCGDLRIVIAEDADVMPNHGGILLPAPRDRTVRIANNMGGASPPSAHRRAYSVSEKIQTCIYSDPEEAMDTSTGPVPGLH